MPGTLPRAKPLHPSPCTPTYKGTANAQGYTYKWQQSSRRFLLRYRLCGDRPNSQPPVMSECWTRRQRHPYQGVTVATVVDHVVPHRGDMRSFWDHQHNWQALCKTCHDKKTRAGL